jgi:hypothetical protein
MIFWRGYGYLAALLPIVALIIGVEGPKLQLFAASSAAIATGASLLGGAAIELFLGLRLNRPARSGWRRMIDLGLLQGDTSGAYHGHSFCWVQLEYWAAPCAALALYLLVKRPLL